MVYESSYPNYLEHYGVKGMKWGIIRSPRKLLLARRKRKADAEKKKKRQKELEKRKREEEAKKKQEERIANKDSILASNNPRLIYENRDLFTTKELNSAYNRLIAEQNIYKMAPQDKNRAKELIDKYVDVTKTIKQVADATKDFYDAINNFNKVFGGGGFDDNNKKKK